MSLQSSLARPTAAPCIAIFEMSRANLAFFQHALSGRGFTILPFLDIFAHPGDIYGLEPDVIILGYFQGYDHSEYETLYALSIHPRTAHIPVIVCTTGQVPSYHDRAQLQLNALFLLKPFSAEVLVIAVEQALINC
jgi:hypothetical protein